MKIVPPDNYNSVHSKSTQLETISIVFNHSACISQLSSVIMLVFHYCLWSFCLAFTVFLGHSASILRLAPVVLHFSFTIVFGRITRLLFNCLCLHCTSPFQLPVVISHVSLAFFFGLIARYVCSFCAVVSQFFFSIVFVRIARLL